jgi:hypothetical protein
MVQPEMRKATEFGGFSKIIKNSVLKKREIRG